MPMSSVAFNHTRKTNRFIQNPLLRTGREVKKAQWYLNPRPLNYLARDLHYATTSAHQDENKISATVVKVIKNLCSVIMFQ